MVNDDMTQFTRRTAIRGIAGTAAVAFVAGCLGDDDDEDDERTPEEVAVDWVSDADNVDDEGDIQDYTGEDAVRVLNGETGDAGNYIFDPGIIRIDSGTEVTWEWTSPGHDLTEVSGQGETISGWDDHDTEEGDGYEHSATFDEAGVALFECVAHRADSQRGAVIVE